MLDATNMVGNRRGLNEINDSNSRTEQHTGANNNNKYFEGSDSSGISKSGYQLDNRSIMDSQSIGTSSGVGETKKEKKQQKRQRHNLDTPSDKLQRVIMDPKYEQATDLLSPAPIKSKGIRNERHHFRIDWRQLTYYQKPDSFMTKLINATTAQSSAKETKVNQKTNPKRILNSLDGCFKSGQLSAILGPSGAGKSTFLSTLFGAKQESAFGQTKVTWFTDDGLPTKAVERGSIKIAFLPQHDHLLHHLTVFESLMFASKIKNATSKHGIRHSETFHRQNVRRVTKMLKLTDCLDTRCGRLSGGQYKRVSIGQELLSEPDVIILDEPTSGLDAMTCLTTVQTLKAIATKHPISIILTIHQPDVDVFGLFDHVYVIAQGGIAIYEGTPNDIVPTLESVGLKMPSANYNPARFIVENAFIIEPDKNGLVTESQYLLSSQSSSDGESAESGHSDEEEDNHEDDDTLVAKQGADAKSFIRSSLLSLTDVISGKEMHSSLDDCKGKKRPLLSIGIQTRDGKLITEKQLLEQQHSGHDFEQAQRLDLINRLNQIQRARYASSERLDVTSPSDSFYMSDMMSQATRTQTPFSSGRQSRVTDIIIGKQCADVTTCPSGFDQHPGTRGFGKSEKLSASNQSDYAPSAWSEVRAGRGANGSAAVTKANSSALISDDSTAAGSEKSAHLDIDNNRKSLGQSLPTVYGFDPARELMASPASSASSETEQTEFVDSFDDPNQLAMNMSLQQPTSPSSMVTHNGTKLRRKFDKRLSAKHNCSKQSDYPIWYHSMLLTHRTWLSIVRDPIFFGIQAVMHTSIPILLSLIFGSIQEEGCPRIGSFDLVDFAYSDSDNMIQGTVTSIRRSIGNIGIVFFEMFVLSFSINCITALIFPLDMYVLLKEYRNGWYTLKSYFFGRTLADLPVPVVLHSIGMTILYILTGQPMELWRFGWIIFVVIIASLVAQSFGLTIGALLMRSSQSAVLAAAGIVAPFFALSGFIVRMHSLPWIAKVGANISYLYHLLNSFIILRYGYGRCQCKEEDFEPNNAHQIPTNLHTLASMWIGTYSNEYADSLVAQSNSTEGNSTLASAFANANKTNVDPNIDVVDKMMTAFRMANSYGHHIRDCGDVLPYAMLDFNLRDHDIYFSVVSLVLMLLVSRCITFSAIYYKIRSFT